MKKLTRIRLSGLSAVLLALLTACGGGGRDDTDPGFDNTVNSIVLATDGSGDIYVGGTFTTYEGTDRNRIARLNSDLSLDAGFDPAGGFNGGVNVVEPAFGSSDIYAAGAFTTYRGAAGNRIARINADGSPGAGFNPGSGPDAIVSSLASATNGSGDIFLGGDFTSYNGNNTAETLIRVNSDGSLDFGFDTLTGFDSAVLAVAQAVDGSTDVIAGGDFTRYDGSLDARSIARINTGSTNEFAFHTGFNAIVYCILLAEDGSGDIYVGGDFTSYNGDTRNRIARINANGTLDTGFSTGSGFNGAVRSLAFATDGSGDIYAGGDFTIFRGNARNGIARVNIDSSNDAGFDSGSGFNGIVRTIAPADNGSGDVYVGGDFTAYQGITANRIIRLDLTGTPN